MSAEPFGFDGSAVFFLFFVKHCDGDCGSAAAGDESASMTQQSN